MPGLRVILEAELPDVQDALRDAGASKFDMLNPLPFEDQSARAIDDKLWTYTARRLLASGFLQTLQTKNRTSPFVEVFALWNC